MLTGIWNNGEMVSNPSTASAGSVSVHQNRRGEFEVRYLGETIGVSASQREANTIAELVSRVLPSARTETA